METPLTAESKALSSLCVLPSTRYSQQEPQEQSILLVRAHPITQLTWIINLILSIALGIFLTILFSMALPIQFVWLIAFVWFDMTIAYAWYNFLLWYYNLGLVTSLRVIDIDYYGVTKRVVTEARMIQVSEATAQVTGFLGQLFDYGSVTVKTEGLAGDIEFFNVPNPERIVSIINNCVRSAHP